MSKKALITGASRGIGRETARTLAEEGYELYLTCSRTFSELEELKAELMQEYKIQVHCFSCDMGDYEEVSALFETIGEVEVLINNAGISYVGLLTDMTPQEWHRIVNTNLNALFYTCKMAVPGMVRRQSGKIINVSSIWGNVGASMEVAYSATKGGVNSFTKALAKELAPSKIQVNAVAFGVIDTQMNDCLSKEEMDNLVMEIPADRVGTAKEAAQMITQLLHAPEYLTGQIITMDGGFI